ncbi:MAG: DNA-directed RNA polymerase subunit A' [Thermoplasmatales archaeon]|nr:DNA-directed RNA polymerase subunit A' [Thermoplasmatales archaeon]
MQGISKRIGSIKFSCISPEEIRKMSAIRVITADTYNDEGYPIVGGLMDKHMGVIEPGIRCETCGCKVDECPGHFGHIELAMPVIHVGFIKDIKSLLESTCHHCGRLLLTEEQIVERMEAMETMERLGGDTADAKDMTKETVKDASSKALCPHCGTEQVKIKLDKPTTFRETADNHKLTPKEVRERLERIPDEDLRTLGMDPGTCRPEWMVLTALAVPPVTVRPSITLDSGDRSEDDLTHKLVDVLRINQRLRENRDNGAPQLIVEDLWELLQYHVTTYFDNQTSGIPPARHRSGRPLKTLTQRLKGKEGRFRSNLSGKRVNFSARTVISPDPLISINEVGVPVEVARELTVPVNVNESNMEVLREMVARGTEPVDGQGKYVPGVNYVIRSDGRRIRVNERNAEDVAEGLELDYTVERQLVDGDIVLFNRQPSLHRMSIMAHRVRVMEGRTFRLNLCVCPPYNADFDGDEMNLHVIQSEEARAEARILMQVQENVLSPRYGGPIIGAIHDHITGAYYLTHENPRFNRAEAMGILSKLDGVEIPAPLIDESGEEYWTGRQLFSIVLPDDFRATFKAAICQNCDVCKKEGCEWDAYVKIRDGELIQGTIDVRGIGNSKGQILDRIARDYGSDRVATFIDQVTRLALGGIMNHGFSTGIDDEDIPDEAKLLIDSFTKECIEKVDELVDSYVSGTLEAKPGRSLEDTFELYVMEALNNARDHAGDVSADHLGLYNPAVIMARAGARGSMLNLSQMAGCVGQQTVRGERINRGYGKRTLPHFMKGDLGAYAKGFVSSSYKSGLSPTEFFFHAMGGREGLVDTAVRTSRSGYMQRRLVSALEDLKLMPDGSVRNTAGTIVQFTYGEDGCDPAKTVQGKSLDVDDLFSRVLGDKADELLALDVEDVGEDYGSREKDEMEFEEESDDYDEIETDYEGD